MIDLRTLPQAVDSLNDALFFGHELATGEKSCAALFLLSRQISSGAHSGLFAPTRQELETGVALFTGERLHTHLGPRNVISAETGRAALLLRLPAAGMDLALQRLQAGLQAECFAGDLCSVGECAHSAMGWMRYLSASGMPDAEFRLAKHLGVLAAHRDGQGQWRGFPYHYTLLALSEINLPGALAEMRYAARRLEKPARQVLGLDEKYIQRREQVRKRVLVRCDTSSSSFFSGLL